MLKLQRLIFRVVRAVFRASRIGKIRIGNSLLHELLRRNLYPLIWKVAAPDLNKPLEVEGHRMCGIGWQRGASNGMGLLMGCYEEETTHIFKNLIQQGMVVVDLGAHIGYYTLIAASRVGSSGKVYAFEPEPTNFKWLLKNIEMNGYRNVIAVPKAIADRTGPLQLYLGNTTGTHSICPAPEVRKESIVVEATTLDDFLSAKGWPHIEVIKMDIEGAEHLALNGMQRLFKRQNTLKLILEFNLYRLEGTSMNPLEFLQRLQANGFTLHSIDGKQSKVLSLKDIASLVARLKGHTNILCCK